jgi:arylsulfatase A-like enzyme
MRNPLLTLLAALWLAGPATHAAEANRRPPNVILILVDDLGWTDLSCFGSSYYQTPNIDRLASRGMKFTQAYSACTVCSPTRAAIQTGKYPARLHLTDWIAGHNRPFAKLKIPDWTQYLRTEETTVAEVLKAVGYTTASIGKWHLGNTNYFPEKHGYDLNLAGYDRGQPPSYFSPYNIPTLTNGPAGEFLTDRESTEAIRFIRANQARPFFLYLPHYAVHTPLMAKAPVIARYKARFEPGMGHSNATYAGLIESVDDSVGRLAQTLQELKLSEQTLILFTSDNGGLRPVTVNTPLRAGKGSAYEGGVRVPFIAVWPGVIKPGTTNTTPIMSIDYLPTLAELAGARVPPGIDGVSLAGLLKGTPLAPRSLFWHYPHYHPGGATPYSAVRRADYRLVEFHETGATELYDLAHDVGESHNLVQEEPAKAAELLAELRAWRQSVQAQMPTPNPNHDPAKDEPPRQRKAGRPPTAE